MLTQYTRLFSLKILFSFLPYHVIIWIWNHLVVMIFTTLSGPPPDACQAYVQESSVASIIAMYYTLHTSKHKDKVGLMRVLGTLANCDSDRAFEDPFLHFLVSLKSKWKCNVLKLDILSWWNSFIAQNIVKSNFIYIKIWGVFQELLRQLYFPRKIEKSASNHKRLLIVSTVRLLKN